MIREELLSVEHNLTCFSLENISSNTKETPLYCITRYSGYNEHQALLAVPLKLKFEKYNGLTNESLSSQSIAVLTYPSICYSFFAKGTTGSDAL